jgi:hypothetical protein
MTAALLINGIDSETLGFTLAEAPGWLDAPPRQTPNAAILGRIGVRALASPIEAQRRISLKGTLFLRNTARLRMPEQFDYGPWTAFGAAVSPGVILTPGGSLVGDKLVEDASNGQHWFGQTIDSGPIGRRATWPVLLKSAERTSAIVTISDGVSGGASILVDLATGALSASGIGVGSWTGITSSSVSLGDGWYLVTVSGVRGAGTSALGQVIIYNAALSYAGTAGLGIYMASAVTDPVVVTRVRLDALKVALSASSLSLVFADHPNRHVNVSLDSVSSPPPVGSMVQETMPVEVSVTAYDPLSYDNNLLTVDMPGGGSAYLLLGTGPVRPVVTVVGAAVNPVIRLFNKSNAVIASLSLAVTTVGGDSLVVDMDAKTVKKNGVSILSAISAGDFFTIDPLDQTNFGLPGPFIQSLPGSGTISYYRSWR